MNPTTRRKNSTWTAILLPLLMAGLCSCTQPTPPLPWAWKGPEPTEADYASARISIFFGGSWMNQGNILLATPNKDGGYDVRVETNDFVNNENIYKVITYTIPANEGAALRKALSSERVSQIREFDPRWRTVSDAGVCIQFIDFIDGRCVAFDFPYLDYDNTIAGERIGDLDKTPTGRWSKAIKNTLRLNSLYEEELQSRQQDFRIDEYKNNTDKLRLQIIDEKITPQEMAGLPGAQLYAFDKYKTEERKWAPEVIDVFMSKSCGYLALKGMNEYLASQDVRWPDDLDKAIEVCRNDPYFIRELEWSIQACLWNAVERKLPGTYGKLVQILNSPIEDENGRNLYRQSVPEMLAFYASQRPGDVRRDLIAALKHKDYYVCSIAAKNLVALRIKEAAEEVYLCGKKQDSGFHANISACALVLGNRRAAVVIRDFLKSGKKDYETRYFLFGISEMTGVPVSEEDVENLFADWPLEDEASLQKFVAKKAIELLDKYDKNDPSDLGGTLEYAFKGAELRRWHNNVWRDSIIAIAKSEKQKLNTYSRGMYEALLYAGGTECLLLAKDLVWGDGWLENTLRYIYRSELMDKVMNDQAVKSATDGKTKDKAILDSLARLADWSKPETVYRK